MKLVLSIFLIFSSVYLYASDTGPFALSSGIDSLLPVRGSFRQQEEDRKKYRFFNDLVGISIKLKLYPLAMKYYFKAMQYKRGLPFTWYQIPGDSAINPDLVLTDADTLVAVAHSAGVIKSEPIAGPRIWEPFKDGKTASAYALIVHVKQPIPGKRRSFAHISNVGHMFITLIKYNDDNTVVSRSFGFYPNKTSFFAATPLHVRSASFFRDDTFHDWDESVGKFISYRRFQKIIAILKKYDHLPYNLNRNNCTDFGLNVANTGGICITDTRGTWPLGKGNNPANAGQSLLEGKFQNTDAYYYESLFVSSNVPAGKN